MNDSGFDGKDVLKEILFMLLKIAAFFIWWCFTLGVISILLLNVWKADWQQMLILAVVLTAIATVVHIIAKLKKG